MLGFVLIRFFLLCMTDLPSPKRDVLFISKATPGDDEFALWLAPRLEAAGYTVYADILHLDPGDRWRRELTSTLQNRAVKMLLCCRDETLAATGVQEEIAIAEDLAKEVSDPNFIIPLKLKKFKKLFGIGGLQYIDFEKHWADGLNKLLKYLEKEKVPCDTSAIRISPNWEHYRRRNAITIKPEPEPLTSNWLRIIEIPDVIRYYEPTGAVDRGAMLRVCGTFKYHAEAYLRGFFSSPNRMSSMKDSTASPPLQSLVKSTHWHFCARACRTRACARAKPPILFCQFRARRGRPPAGH
jgi:TIR domain